MSPFPSLRFRFRDLGPLTDAELQIGGLTVIAGRNNSGKTYLLNALYGFLELWRQLPAAVEEVRKNPALGALRAFFREAATTCLARRTVSLTTVDRERRILLGAMSAAYSSGVLDRVLGAPAGTLSGASVGITLEPLLEGRLVAQGVELRGRKFVVGTGADGLFMEGIPLDPNGADSDPAGGSGGEIPDAFDPANLVVNLIGLYVLFVLPELRFVVRQLPAEAAAVFLFQPDVDFNRNRIVDLLRDFDLTAEERASAASSFLRKAASRYALPVKDTIDSVRELPSAERTPHPVLRGGVSRMMDGDYEADGDGVYFHSRDGAERDFRIPLPLASTSARSLAGLYYAEIAEGFHENLLLIDEPEASLDTGNQVELARILARLVRSGVRILIATHSDYLIKEFNNLIVLSRVKDRKAVRELLGYAADEFLAPDDVCAFVTENGGLTCCDVDAYGMNMPIFDKTIDSINSAANLLASRVAR